MSLGTRYQIPGTRYQVPGTRYQVPGSCYLVPGTWYQVPGTSQVPGTWYQIPGTRYLVPDTWYQAAAPARINRFLVVMAHVLMMATNGPTGAARPAKRQKIGCIPPSFFEKHGGVCIAMFTARAEAAQTRNVFGFHAEATRRLTVAASLHPC